MSAPTARRLLTAGSLSLALALAAPAAAFAGPDDGPGENGKGGGKPRPQATSTASPAPGSSAQGGSAQGGSAPSGQGGSSASGPAREKPAKKAKQTPSERAAKGDPRGNNGTVKIDGLAFDSTPGNEPKVGCTFQIDFFGFDADDTADITLTAHAPTAGPVVWSATDRLISRDAAGGGKDVDESITLSVDPDLRGLLALAPHAQQGWHVKLAVDVDSAPGGAKQKVFWIDCPQTPAVPGVTGTTAAPATAPATGGGTFGTQAVDRAPLAPTFGSGTLTAQGVAGTSLQAASGGKGAGAATVAARGAARPSALPFTGAEGLGYLLALGLSAVGVGTLAHRLGRRRATTV